MNNRVFLVTGGSGHLGNQVVRKLLERGDKVFCLLMEKSCPPSLMGLDIEVVHGDVRDKKSLGELFSKASGKEAYVLHLASKISIASKVDDALRDINVEGTRNVIELCQRYQVRRLIYCSSVHAIPEKENGEQITEVDTFSPDLVVGAYAKTKAKASELVLDAGKSGLDVVLVHPSGILGPYDYMRQGRVNQLLLSMLSKKYPLLVHGGYDFVDVRDVADGILVALDRGKAGNSYILSGHYSSLLDLSGIIAKTSGRKVSPLFIPRPLAFLAMPFLEAWDRLRGKDPLYTRYALYTLNSNSNFSHEKATRELGYRPRALEKTVRDTAEFFSKI